MNPQEQPEEKQPKVIRVATLLTILLILLILVAGFIVTRWAYEPSQALVINNKPVPVEPPEVKDGGKVFLTINYCQKKTLTMHTEVHLIGEQGADIDVVWPTSTVPKGCNLLTEIPVKIPGQTPTDTYYAEFTSCGDVNPLKKDKCTIFKSKHFKVVNSKLSPGDAQVEEEK